MITNAAKETYLLTRRGLETLLGQKSENCTCVSIFMPVQKTGREMQQNATRLKNLIGDAEKRLVETCLRRPEAIKLLAPASVLPDNSNFWQHQSLGLAIFLSKEIFRPYRVPLDFKDTVVVADRFHLKPLLPILSGDVRFYILALSQNEIRLLQCSHYGTREIDLKGIIPGSLNEILKDGGATRVQSHHSGAPERGKEGEVFHTQDIGDMDKNNILRFFQRVDRGLHGEILKEEIAPLILAAVSFLQPIYQKANTYKHLFEKGIAGNPDRVSSSDLHERAWEMMKPFFNRAKEEAMNEYRQLAGSGQTPSDMQEILANAYAGKIDVLFVALDKEQWGTFDPGKKKRNCMKAPSLAT